LNQSLKPISPRRPLKVRPCRDDDLPAVEHLLYACGFPDVPEVMRLAKRVDAVPYCGIGFTNDHVDDQVVGFLLALRPPQISRLSHVFVLPSWRRQLVASQMVSVAVNELFTMGRTKIQSRVSEENLTAQLFFRSMSFRWVETLEDENDPDGRKYVMEFRPGERKDSQRA
jgi:ribosomal protein S18 acetylase RimI-like enzyme